MNAHQLRLYAKLQSTAHLIKKVADRKLMEAAGITAAQAGVLAVVQSLVQSLGHASQKQVAERLNLNESALTAMVNRLMALGLIERRRSESDGRTWQLYISEKGKSVMSASQASFDALNSIFDAVMDECTIQEFADNLKSLNKAFDEI